MSVRLGKDSKSASIATLLLGICTLAGCESVPKDKGFGAVQKTVSERTGVQVRWDRDTSDDRAARAGMDQLLQAELTDGAAVQIALLNNPTLQASYEELGIAQADLVQAGLLKNPVFSGQIRFPPDPVMPLELDVFFDFISLLQMPLRQKAAKAVAHAAQNRVIASALETAAETRGAFYTLQGAEQLVEMRRAVVDATDASAIAAQELFRVGNVNELFLRSEESLAAQSRLDLAGAQADVVLARERLNVLMGLWGERITWKIAARLPAPPGKEIEGRGLESLAISQRPDLQSAAADVRSRADTLGLAKTFSFLAETNVGAHFEREPDGKKTVGPSIDLPIPLFDTGQATIARADAVLWQSYRRHEALAIEARSQVRSAYARLLTARAKSEYYRVRVLPLSQQVLDQTQRQFNAMQIGVFQLLQARQSQIDAGRSYIESLRDYWVSRAELEKAVGGRLPSEAMTPATHPMEMTPATAPASGGHQHEHH